MKSILTDLVKSCILSGDIKNDVSSFLEYHKHPRIADHSMKVADEAKRLARKFGLDENSAAIAGLLHDISVVFPNDKRIEVAKALGIDLLIEEETFPMIIHQKISRVMAKELFGISDDIILNAIGCHTTLRANASALDLVEVISK